MPYIGKEHRARLDPLIDALGDELASLGEVAYVTFRLLDLAASAFGERDMGWSEYCGASGTVLGAVREWQRTRVDSYEDGRRRENGDI